MLAITDVSVSSRMSRAGSIACSAMASSTTAAKRGSPIDLPDTFTARVRSRPAARRAAISWMAWRITHASMAWIRPNRSATCRNTPGGSHVVAVPQAQQDLVVRHGVGGEVEDRLAVELEPFLAQRAAQPLDLVDALGHALRAGAGVGVDDHPVATAHLRLVHRVVGVGQHLQVAETIEGGDTGAGRDVDDLVAERRRVPAQRLHQLARDHRRLLDGHLGQQHRELVAAEARQHVGVPVRARSAAATPFSMSSPALCPNASLTSLKLSRSSTTTAPPRG